MLWNDNKNNNLPFLNNILMNMPKEVNDSFYIINRKCRNNIHYGFYNEVSMEELINLKIMQEIYLNYVVKEFVINYICLFDYLFISS